LGEGGQCCDRALPYRGLTNHAYVDDHQELQPDEDYGNAGDHLGSREAHEDDEQQHGQTISAGTFGILYDGSDDEGESKRAAQPQQPTFSLARPTFSLAQPTFRAPVHSQHHQQHHQQFRFTPQVAAGGDDDDDEL
jgi:hypothetical protein